MDPIRTTSGKTARDNLAALRQRRQLIQPDQTDAVLDKLEALADQSYRVIRMLRTELNALRLQAVDAKQTVMNLRKQRKVDLEL